jgi:starch synthase
MNQMMRAIHLLRKLDPAEWGGTETAILRLCDGLRENGVKPVVYCPRLERESASDPLQLAGCEVARYRAFVPVLGLPPERRRQLVAVGGNIMSFDLVAALWREEDVSVIHSHALGRIGGIALTVAKQRRIPFVVSIHGGVLDLPDSIKSTMNAPNERGWEWGKFFGLLFQSHRLFVDADAIVTCNQKEAALLSERHPEKRVVVQTHGVPVSLFQEDHSEAAYQAFPQLRDQAFLLCMGRIDPFKNQAWLMEQAPEILRRHPDLRLVLAGPCTDEPYGELVNRKIRELGLGEKVILTGGLPPNDPRLIGLLQRATALVLPSVSETFGLIILEAWAAGTMVLSSRTSGASALIKDGENGWLFDLAEPGQFHEALAQTIINPARARLMAAKGFELVQQEHSVQASAGRMKKIYEEVIEEKACAT